MWQLREGCCFAAEEISRLAPPWVNSSRIPNYFETARAALSISSETSFGCET